MRDAGIKVLAIASGGGHWEELMLLRPALASFDAVFATTNAALGERDAVGQLHVLPDSNRHRPVQALRSICAVWRVVRRVRPDFVVTTGALPGLIGVLIGRLYGAKAIWVDSVANSEVSSMSGRCARPFTALWLTQWEHLGDGAAARFAGALL